jgi:hypothetical protein
MVGAAIVAGAVVFVLQQREEPAPKTADAPAPAVAPAPPALPAPIPPPIEPPPVAPPVVDTITLRFAIDPPTAKITIDGKPVEGGETTVKKDDAVHQLEITAPGHLAHAEELRFDETQRIRVQLDKATRGQTGRRSNPGKPGKPNKPDRIDTESPYKQ